MGRIISKRVMPFILALAMVFSFAMGPVKEVRADDITTIKVTKTIKRRTKDDILKRINEIRLEFYNENKKYHYVSGYSYKPIKWSSDLEEIAYIRAVEASIYFSHTRPNGNNCFTTKSSNGQTSFGEIIASSPDAVNAINQWYDEKTDYIAQLSGDTSNKNEVGHYTSLLYSDYIGIASFGVTAGETSSIAGKSEDQIAPTGTKTESVSVKSGGINLVVRNDGYQVSSISIDQGNTTQLSVGVANSWGGVTVSGSWSSSNTNVARVDSTGMVKGVAGGTANITFKSGSLSKVISVTVKGNSSASVSNYSNEWVNGVWYNKDGSQTYTATGSWKKNNKGWWFEDTSGWYPRSQWQKINGKWYYFLANGYMASGEYRSGNWFNYDGSWDPRYSHGHWCKNNKGWWYADGNWYPKNRSVKIDGVMYHFNAAGYWDY